MGAFVGCSAGADPPPIVAINAARAAACAGLSCARTEIRLAQTAMAQITGNDLETCIRFFTPIPPPTQQLSGLWETGSAKRPAADRPIMNAIKSSAPRRARLSPAAAIQSH